MVSLDLGEDGASRQNDVGQASNLPAATADTLRLRDHLVIIDHTRVR